MCVLIAHSPISRGADVPTDKPANYPRWWFERGIVERLNDSGNAPPLWVHHDYPVPDDFAVANLGQLKQIASKAAQEMNAALPDGAGLNINNLMVQWSTPPASGVVRDDYAALNVGQLKAVAAIFYDRLIAIQYANGYPWANGTPDDYAVANLGQLKSLFSFDLTRDSDGDGIPDWWETRYGLNPHNPSDAGLLSQDGEFTNLQKYLQGLNPTTADSDGDGIPDAAEIAAGTNPAKKDAPLVHLQVFGYTAP